MTSSHIRHWGDGRALLDDVEARGRLLDAAERCIVTRGDIQIRMAEVAVDAGVARSTLYRYYSTRDELLLGLVLRRMDNAFARWVGSLRRPRDAAASIRALVLKPVAAVNDDDPLNRALYANETSALIPILEASTQPVIDVMAEHIAPLLKQWKSDGQIYADLDVRETLQWMSATSSFLLTTDWRHRPAATKRRFVDRYLIRALVL